MTCKNCGHDYFYSKFIGIQYYDKNGEPDGFEESSYDAIFVRCTKCGTKVKLSTLQQNNNCRDCLYYEYGFCKILDTPTLADDNVCAAFCTRL